MSFTFMNLNFEAVVSYLFTLVNTQNRKQRKFGGPANVKNTCTTGK